MSALSFFRSAPLALLCATGPSFAASPLPYGGEVRVVHSQPEPVQPSFLTDTLEEASLRSFSSRGPCRLDTTGALQPALALSMRRLSAHRLQVDFAEAAHALAFARAWAQLKDTDLSSPYSALFFPVREAGQKLKVTGKTVELTLSFLWPDLERSLCHPVWALTAPGGTGPFVPSTATRLEAQPRYAEGRPFLDRLLLQRTDVRGLSRAWPPQEPSLVLGAPASEAPAAEPLTGPALQATYLAFSPRRTPPDFRAAVEAILDRTELTRFHLQGSARALLHLLPSETAPFPAPTKVPPPPHQPPQALSLLYDAGLTDHRLVAERLQVKLHERGYTLALEPLTRVELRRRFAQGNYQLLLHTLLLPPTEPLALAVLLEAAGRHDLLGLELQRLGSISEDSERATKARQRALTLAPSLPLLPLYTQGLSAKTSPQLHGGAFDAQGLFSLDAAYLVPATPSSP